MKTCKICGEEKELKAFWKRTDSPTYRNICKACRNKKRRDDYKKKKLEETRNAKKTKEEHT